MRRMIDKIKVVKNETTDKAYHSVIVAHIQPRIFLEYDQKHRAFIIPNEAFIYHGTRGKFEEGFYFTHDSLNTGKKWIVYPISDFDITFEDGTHQTFPRNTELLVIRDTIRGQWAIRFWDNSLNPAKNFKFDEPAEIRDYTLYIEAK